LFLPSGYTPEKDWPILYALYPSARGHIPVELFRLAAEEYNYILVGSNDSQNGPWQHVIQSLIVLWNDTNERFSIDKKRIYVTGFSGGARAASIFSRVIIHPVAGIIGCGAGLAKSLIKPEQIHPAYYLGIVGMADFNYREMMMLRSQFQQQDIAHRFFIHKGGHDWPPAKTCLRAIEWLEVIGMQKNIRPKDDELIRKLYEKEQAEARTLESTDEFF
jgi:predicted esterase